MENMNNSAPRRPNPRRKRRSRLQKMIRAYLPLAGVLALVILFIIFAAGSVRRSNEKREQARQESIAVSQSLAQVQLELEQAAKELVKEADKLAASCEFDKALEMLDTFEGNPDEFDVIVAAKQRYQTGDSALVAVEDIRQVKCLSFGSLIRNPEIAFTGDTGEDNRYSYISTAEFTRILQELYDNGYMLVDIYDLFTTTKAEDGSTLIVKNELKLPEGKKPIMLVNTQPSGYQNKLVLDDNGYFTSVYTDENGSITGSFDFVPLLEDFIRSNPGFSYKGSRAMLALTAHNGLFGYALTETTEITNTAEALKELGYVLAGNTFSNAAYGKISLLELVDDISNWNVTATPLLGETQVLVYARSSDIDDGKESYSGKKYEKLYEAGFRYYFGTCYNSNPWMDITDNTVRLGRIMVTGNNLKNSAALYEGLFDASKILG